MAERDTFITIANGDQLNEGYFNDILSLLGKIGTNGSIVPPIGAVIPWAKSMTGTPVLPDGWLECDGSTISDADSPMNGQAVPNLQTNNPFVRGDTTSDATATASSHDHGGSTGSTEDIGSSGTRGQTHTITSATTHYYVDMVWIIRVK